MSEHFAPAGADANQIRGCELSILRHFSKKLFKVMTLFRTCLHGICTEICVNRKHSSFSYDNVPSLKKKSSVIRTYADLRIHSFMKVFKCFIVLSSKKLLWKSIIPTWNCFQYLNESDNFIHFIIMSQRKSYHL